MIELDFIDIDKDLIPYKFEMNIDGNTYEFDIKYNSTGDFFTVDLYKDKKALVLGEKIIYAKPLFLTCLYKDIPFTSIIPYDLSGRTKEITFENFNKDVFLFLVGDDDVD